MVFFIGEEITGTMGCVIFYRLCIVGNGIMADASYLSYPPVGKYPRFASKTSNRAVACPKNILNCSYGCSSCSCSMSQYVAVCRSMSQDVAVCRSMLQYVAGAVPVKTTKIQ